MKADKLLNKEFREAVANRQRNGERYGQAVYNCAYELFPEEVNQLGGSNVDPFYSSGMVRDFIRSLIDLVNKSNS